MADAPKSPIPNLPPIDPEALQKSLRRSPSARPAW
jgi:hypothetical protein